jgi:hypothetical protein
VRVARRDAAKRILVGENIEGILKKCTMIISTDFDSELLIDEEVDMFI